MYDTFDPKEVVNDNFICTLPDGELALFITSKESILGWWSDQQIVTFYFVFCHGMHVWISSEDAELESIA